MTLRDLKESLSAIRLHDLAETNALDVRAEGGAVFVEIDSGLEYDLKESRQECNDLAAQLKEAEAERDEWERRCLALESHADEMRERGELGNVVFDLRADVERLSTRAREWAKECENMQKELSAIRKRKGVAAGVCAYSHEVWTLLCYVSQLEGRYQKEARALLDKISLL